MKSRWLVDRVLLLIFLLTVLNGCSSSNDTLTFDGETCQYAGPQVITEGHVTVILDNKTDYELSLWAGRLSDGRTWQDMLDYIGTPGASKELPAWAEWRALAAKVPDNPNAAVYTPNEGLYAINCCTCGEIKGLTGFAAAAVAGSNALVTAAYGCIAMGRCSSRLDFW